MPMCGINKKFDRGVNKVEKSKLLLKKNVVITGASRGIGLETAKVLAVSGATLILTELENQMENLEKQAELIRNEFSVDVTVYSLDVRKHEQIVDVVKSINEKYGNVDVLVNNIGINLLTPALSLRWEEWDMVLDTNLKGNFFMTQEIAKLMVKKGKGSIISIASQHGVVGNENRAAYCASKAGLINLTRVLAIEFAKHGIRANTVSPTFVITEANKEILESNNFKRNNLNKIPLKKYALPEDVAHAVAFLASDLSKMITGHNLVVDGGWTAL